MPSSLSPGDAGSDPYTNSKVEVLVISLMVELIENSINSNTSTQISSLPVSNTCAHTIRYKVQCVR